VDHDDDGAGVTAVPTDDVRPWVGATAAALAAWPVLAEPLVDALVAGRPTAAAVGALADELTDRMIQVARAAARITAHEAAGQGVDNPGGEPDEERIAKLAETFAGVIASGYGSVALQATLGVPLTEAGRLKAAAAAVTAAVRTALTALGTAVSGLVPTQVGAAMTAGEHEGTVSVYAAHPPRYLVAAEIHEDENRCLPCEEINGTRYETLADGLEDYPTVGYRLCRGGIRCRGRLRGVWSADPEPLAESARVVLAEADDEPEHTGAMIALVPTAEDAARLTVDGGEDPDELHLTLAYFGDNGPIGAAARQQLFADLGAAVNGMPVVEGNAFAPAVFNPAGDEPCRVVLVGGDTLDGVHHFLMDVLRLPGGVTRHAPWMPHITLAYGGDLSSLEDLVARLGPVSFDRVRLAIAGQHVDIPLVAATDDDEQDDVDQPDGDWALVEAEGDRNSLRTYFTATPKGLKRWAGKKHAWTALFKILRKRLDPERAKRVTSAWYLRVFHHTPNQHIAEAAALTEAGAAGAGHPSSCDHADLASICSCGCNGSRHGEHGVAKRLGNVKADMIARQGGNMRLQAMTDDELAGQFADLSRAGKWDQFEAVTVEMDRREKANEWLEPEAADTHWDAGDEPTEEDRQVDALVARGYDYAGAYAEVYGGDEKQLRAQQRADAVDRRDGETLDDAVRRGYDQHVYEQYLRAEGDTNGHLLTSQAETKGVDPVSLFSGPARIARANASEDLLRWWADNGRLTLTEFRADALGRDSDRKAAALTRVGANGKDFI
jgi:hypothetical protein